MVILFVVSSLEPRRDGVGDYARLLALELVRQGHRCHLLGLHDEFVAKPVHASIEGEPSIQMLRLPTSSTW